MKAYKTVVLLLLQIFFLSANSFKTPQEARKALTEELSGKISEHIPFVADEDVEFHQDDLGNESSVLCLQNNMILTIPKPVLAGADREHIRALDLNCKASENHTHFLLDVPLTGCGTNIRHAVSSVIYSNVALPAPPMARDVVSHVPDFEIPFHCYYDNNGLVTSVGLKPVSKKVIFSQKGFGKFSLALDLFPDERFTGAYGPRDFPVMKKLRERIFFEASVDTNDDRLTILAKNCYATPSPDKNSEPKYWIIQDGCKVDDTVIYHPSGHKSEKFSIESFTFIGEHAFIFLHCHVRVCNVSDEHSNCVRVCEDRRRRDVGLTAETLDDVYPLAQGPLTLEKEKQAIADRERTRSQIRSSGPNIPVITVLAALIVLCVIAISRMLCQRETEVVNYTKLVQEIED